MAVPTSLPAGHILLGSEAQGIVDEINARKLIARGNRTSNSSTTTTTEIGVLRVDGVPVTLGRAYWIGTSTLFIGSTQGADIVEIVIRASTTGSATTSSTQITTAQSLVNNINFPQSLGSIGQMYIPGATATLSILLSFKRVSGTGTVQILSTGSGASPIDIYIIDMGADPGDTGIDL